MNNKFRIGDKVRIIAADHGQPKRLIGGIHNIYRVTGSKEYMLDSDGGWYWSEYELKLVKPKFDIKDYPGNYVMHVTSEEQAKIFCEYLHSIGRRWISGSSYMSRTNYKSHGISTCYAFNVGECDRQNWYLNVGYTILEFNDFDWSDFTMKKEFTKADLKNGDFVKLRDGSVGVAIVDVGAITFGLQYMALNDLRDDLTNRRESNCDIMAIRRPNSPLECIGYIFDCKNGKLVYERKEAEEMTLEEVCKALGKEIKIVKK